jgi:hypothetical protein
VLIRAAALGTASVVVAAGLGGWLLSLAGPDALRPVAALAALAVLGLAGTLILGWPDSIAVPLALLGAAYAAILVIDDPPLDSHSILVGGALLAAGELAYLSLEARSAVTEETGAIARRFAGVSMLVLFALAVGGALLAVVDLLRTGGLVIEFLGVAAAAGAVGLLVLAARDARGGRSES